MKRTMKRIVPVILLAALASLAMAEEVTIPKGVWIHPKCNVKPFAKGAAYRIRAIQLQCVELSDGSVLTVQSGARGATTLVSQDDGRTWSDPRPFVYEGPPPGIPGVGPLVRTRDGVIIMVYADQRTYNFSWDSTRGEPREDNRRDIWSIRSLNEGRTWVDRQQIFDGYCGALVNMIQTESGHIVVPVQDLVGDPGRNVQYTYVSADDGKTWTRSNRIDLGGRGPHGGVCEGTVAELSDGRLLMLLRTTWGRFWEAYSDDHGYSWREIHPSQIEAPNRPGHLHRLASGRLVLAWNHLNAQELSIAFSKDDAKTWTEPVVIARYTEPLATARGDADDSVKLAALLRRKAQLLSYPTIFERRPGQFWIVVRQGTPVWLSLPENDFVPAP